MKFKFITMALFSLLFIGCHKPMVLSCPAPPAPVPPSSPIKEPEAHTLSNKPVSAILIVPTEVVSGQPTTVFWHTKTATTATIEEIGNVPLNGQKTWYPTIPVTLHLTATNGKKKSRSKATVLVVPAKKESISSQEKAILQP